VRVLAQLVRQLVLKGRILRPMNRSERSARIPAALRVAAFGAVLTRLCSLSAALTPLHTECPCRSGEGIRQWRSNNFAVGEAAHKVGLQGAEFLVQTPYEESARLAELARALRAHQCRGALLNTGN
jgi:hypothetical protein